MFKKSAFTLVELMVVVVIVALLAALLIPMLTKRVEAARWSEGKAAAGTIATALRAYVIERAELEPDNDIEDIIIKDFMSNADLNGKYFIYSDYELDDISYNPAAADTAYVVTYTITVNPGNGPSVTSEGFWTKAGYTLDHTGKWEEVEASE